MYRKLIISASLFLLLACNYATLHDKTVPPPTTYGLKLSQYGITWYFDQAYTHGTFVNGDHWVIPQAGHTTVRIIFIDPHSHLYKGRIKNGSMINPDPNIVASGYHFAAQGYDSAMYVSTENHYYSELNVAFDVNVDNPLDVNEGSSLVSTISIDKAHSRPTLKTCAILTVLASAPPDTDCFRPPYSGTDKTCYYQYSDVEANLGLLGSLDVSSLSSIPTVTTASGWFARPWLDHVPQQFAGYIHPADNMPQYGFLLAERVGDMALWLHTNVTDNAGKKNALVGFIQYGIDSFGVTQNGYVLDGKVRQWMGNGGHAAGRKWPILFAGIMLGNTDMQQMVTDLANYVFQEDEQILEVDADDVSPSYSYVSLCGESGQNFLCGGYENSMVTMPEWGINNVNVPERNTARWVTMYRQCCTARGWGGIAMAIHIMNTYTLWGNDTFLRYVDRFISYEKTYGDHPTDWQDSAFIRSMWNEFRDDYEVQFSAENYTTFNQIVYDKYN